jgi:hypothetical protein
MLAATTKEPPRINRTTLFIHMPLSYSKHVLAAPAKSHNSQLWNLRRSLGAVVAKTKTRRIGPRPERLRNASNRTAREGSARLANTCPARPSRLARCPLRRRYANRSHLAPRLLVIGMRFGNPCVSIPTLLVHRDSLRAAECVVILHIRFS